jgi:O-antigen/teichoic acid export membrane protein
MSELDSPPALGAVPGVRADLLLRWTKILSAYFSAQTAVQLLGFATGLLFIRLLAVREYALYTLAFSVVSFFAFATDLGSTSSLVYFFHRTRRDGGDFAPYAAAVESLRRWAFGLGALAVVLAFPPAALAKGFQPTETLLAAGAIFLAVWFQIGASIRVLGLRLAGRYGRSYRAEIAGGGVRLALALALAAPALLSAWLAVATAAAAAAATAAVAGWGGEARGRPDAGLGPYRRQVVRYLAPTLPSALYFSIQAPLVVWLAASFGSTRNVAEVGALGRLGMVVSLFTGLAGTVFLPRLANLTDEGLWRRRYCQYGGFLAAIALGLVAGAALVPDLFLLLLGDQYAGLHLELLLVMVSAGLTLLDGYAVGVNHSRSWNRWQGPAVVVIFAVQALLVALLDLSSTRGVLLFGVATGGVGLAAQVVMTLAAFVRREWVEWKVAR